MLFLSTYCKRAVYFSFILLLISACSKKISKNISDGEPIELRHHTKKSSKQHKKIDVEDCVELGKSFSKKKEKKPIVKSNKQKEKEAPKKKEKNGWKALFYILLALAGLAVSIFVVISFTTTLAATFSLLLLWVLIGYATSALILIGFAFFLAFQALMNIGSKD